MPQHQLNAQVRENPGSDEYPAQCSIGFLGADGEITFGHLNS